MPDNSTMTSDPITGPSYTINGGDTGWVMICACLVFLMSPALGFFYAGLARAKNALSLMYLTVLSVAVVSFQWYLIGYSLTFSETGGKFIGDTAHFLLRGVGTAPTSPQQTIPAAAFMIFQCMFAAVTPALAFGSAAERMSLGPAIIFIFVWTTLVYDIITCWVWGPNGFLTQMGVMDFAGGTPVHISSGLAAVAYAVVVGKRRDYHENVNTPHNVSFVFLGLILMWFGWFAFNAGSALAANARSVNSLVCTHLSACTAGVVWVLLDYRHSRKWSIIGLCTGVVAGLATITPGSGFVTPSSALAFGAIGSLVCYVALNYKHKYGFDDALDVFAVHYIGGLVGLILTGVFAQRKVIALGYPEGTPLDEIPIGGWLDGHFIQVPIQLAAIVCVSVWSFVVTYIILIVINKIPSLQLRLADEDEIIGTDWAQMGERAYGYIPFYEGADDSPRRSDDNSQPDEERGPDNNNHNSSSTASSTTTATTATAPAKKSASKHFKNIRKLLMTDRNTIIKRVPDLIEEPVLDYGQKKDHQDNNGGSIRLHELPTGGDIIQMNQHQTRPAAHHHHHHHSTPSTSQASSGIVMIEIENTSSTLNEGSSSSNSSDKMKERA